LGPGLCRSSPTRRHLRDEELAALLLEIAARDGEQIRAVLDGLRERHDHFRVARPQHPHLLGLAEDHGRLLPEVQPAQRHRLLIEVDECGEHNDLLPSVEVVGTAVARLRVLVLLLTGSHCCPRAADGANDHHRSRGESVSNSPHDYSSPCPQKSNDRTTELYRGQAPFLQIFAG
jgi:hypothetical protein